MPRRSRHTRSRSASAVRAMERQQEEQRIENERRRQEVKEAKREEEARQQRVLENRIENNNRRENIDNYKSVDYQEVESKEIKEQESFINIKSTINLYTNKKHTATAPYNFIEFPQKVIARYKGIEELPKFDKFYKDLNTGFIEYKFTSETPIFVGDEKVDGSPVRFFRNADGKFAIPGSTMRGLIRSNSEILGFAYPQFIEDQRFLYRKMAARGKIRREYNEIISTTKEIGIDSVVKAGYVYKEKGDYYLIPAKEKCGKSFYPISEKDLKEKLDFVNDKIKFMYKSDIGKVINDEYSPYETLITFDKTEKNKITKISINSNLNNRGVLINSNHINKKNKHYIVNEMFNRKFKIDSQIIVDYKNDCERNKQRTNNKFYELPEEDGLKNKKVFFYKLENSKVAYLGRSPYLRIFYRRSVRDCIGVKSVKEKIDYADAMYGFTREINNEKQNYKSRLSFTDAKCFNEILINEDKMFVLASPKASCFTFYLKQDKTSSVDNVITYNNPEAKLRGTKFYWLTNAKNDCIDLKNKNIATKVKDVLDEGSEFKGRIYFENLNDDELGLLLMSIKFKEDCKESIGMAKPYGMGRVNFDSINLFIEKDRFISFESEYTQQSTSKYKEIFLKEMNSYLKKHNYNQDYLNTKTIKSYYSSKKEIVNAKDTSYMELGSFKEDNILPMI